MPRAVEQLHAQTSKTAVTKHRYLRKFSQKKLHPRSSIAEPGERGAYLLGAYAVDSRIDAPWVHHLACLAYVVERVVAWLGCALPGMASLRLASAAGKEERLTACGSALQVLDGTCSAIAQLGWGSVGR